MMMIFTIIQTDCLAVNRCKFELRSFGTTLYVARVYEAHYEQHLTEENEGLSLKARGGPGSKIRFPLFFKVKSSTLEGIITFYRMKISSPAL